MSHVAGRREPLPPRGAALVINGDDFGYSAAINRAIVEAHEAGGLTSATLLVNQGASREALRLARRYPTLGVGWHVNLTEGGPVLPPGAVPSLVDRRGQFRPLGAQLAGLAGGRVRVAEVERELRAQLALLLDAGLTPTHADGHLHAHAFPHVLPIVLRIMAERRIPALRSPLLGSWLPPRAAAARLVAWAERRRAMALRRRGVVLAGRLLDASRFLSAPDPVVALVAALERRAGASVEIMTHPAWNRDAARGTAEVALLTDRRLHVALDALGRRRVHYGQLVDDSLVAGGEAAAVADRAGCRDDAETTSERSGDD